MIRNSGLLFIQKFKYFCHTEENVQLKIYKFENIHSFLIISNLEQLALIIKEISFELRIILMFLSAYLFLVFFKKFKSVIYLIGNINKNQLNILEMYSYIICSEWKAVTKNTFFSYFYTIFNIIFNLTLLVQKLTLYLILCF